MSDNIDPTIQALIDYAQAQAQDGAEVLQELDPELPFVQCSDLVGQRVIFLDFEERQGPYPDPFYSCRVLTPEGDLMRMATGSNAIKKKLDLVKDRLPLHFTITEHKSEKSGLTYHDIE